MTDFNKQMPSLWGMARCPPPTSNLTTDNSTLYGQYESGMILCSTHVGIALAYAIVLLFCFSGVQKVTMRGSFDTLLQILPCYRNLDHGATSNTRFVLYFLCSALAYLITIVALLLDQNEVSRAPRIVLQVCQRLFMGAAAVLLTISLNHQREHRHTDAFYGDIGIVQLVGQIRNINYATVIFFSCYVIAEIVVSFVTPSHTLRVIMASVAFVADFILTIPIVAAALWIAFHKGHVAPAPAARAALIIGCILRFIGFIDASFWNKLVLQKWISSDPCFIAGKLSFYNLLQILDMVGQTLILSFVVSEFRRSRSIVTEESSLLATAQYDDFNDNDSSNPSEGDLQRHVPSF